MGNLFLGHPLASWPLSNWITVWGTSFPLVWQWLVAGLAWLGHILVAAPSQSHSHPSVHWLHLKTSCPHLCHGHCCLDIQGPLVQLISCYPHMMCSQDSCFWSVSTSFLLPAMQERQAVISPATLAAFTECYGQCTPFILFPMAWQCRPIININHNVVCCSQ